MKTYAMLKTCTQALVASVILGVAFTPCVYAASVGVTETSTAVSNVEGDRMMLADEKRAELKSKLDALKDEKKSPSN